MYPTELNDQQRAFVESPSKHITVSARPGTGKTHSFAWRIVRDQAIGVDPSSQIIVTKTVAAALQMEQRIEIIASKNRLEPIGKPYFIGTIHALALHIMNAHGYVLGYTPDIEVLPEDDSRKIMNDICEGLGANNTTSWKLRGMLARKTVEDLAAKAHLMQLRRNNRTDFACMLTEAARIMNSREDQGFHIYVDEYQDTTVQEADLLRSLKPNGWIIIGDEDQSIFTWDKLLDNFYAWESRVMSMGENRRSGEVICNAANRLASHFEHYRPGADPMTFVQSGGGIGVVQCKDDSESIQRAIDMASADLDAGCSVAILCRHNHLANQIKVMAGPSIAGVSVDMMDGAKAGEIRNAQVFLSKLSPESLASIDPTFGLMHLAIRSSNLTNRERRIVEVAISKSRGSKFAAISAILDQEEHESNKLHIGTVHSFKGREADHVYLVGAEEHRWEAKQSITNDERKIFYVALTRARSSFTAIHATNIRVEGKGEIKTGPSKFIEEMNGP